MTVALLLTLFAGTACGLRAFAESLPVGVEPSPRMLLRPPPLLTFGALLVIGIVSSAQLVGAAGLLDVLERNAARIADGQVWRLVTALLVQDGGWAGMVSNLAFLAVLGTLGEKVLGPRRAGLAWLSGALTGELVGLAWQPVGGGNSVGNLGLAGALAVTAVARGGRMAAVPAVVVAAGAAVLLAGRDLHGAATVGGAAAAAVMTVLDRRR